MKTGYTSMLHPMVEYVCPTWNPHHQYLSDKLEQIKQNASNWILGKDSVI